MPTVRPTYQYANSEDERHGWWQLHDREGPQLHAGEGEGPGRPCHIRPVLRVAGHRLTLDVDHTARNNPDDNQLPGCIDQLLLTTISYQVVSFNYF